MYRRRGRQSDYQAFLKKFLEHTKDPLKRLKSLKHGLEKLTPLEVKDFYREHSSTIFFVFYSSFTTTEAAIQDRVARGKGYSELHLKELMEVVLPALEKTLVTLPELIHRRWQFNCICLIIRKLLHPENTSKLRQYGIKLLVLWLQALQENAGDACMGLFASAVPNFPPEKTPMGLPAPPSPSHTHVRTHTRTPSSLSLCERYGTYSTSSLGSHDSTTPLIPPSKSTSAHSLAGTSSSREAVCVNVLHPLCPSYSGLSDHEITLKLMSFLLRCLTEEVGRLKWEDPSNHFRGFAFLFFLFKLFYLACLYKNFRTEAGLYTSPPPPKINLPLLKKTDTDTLQAVQEESSSQESEPDILNPTPSLSTHSSTSSLLKKHPSKRTLSPYRMSSVIKLEYDLSKPVYAEIKQQILGKLLDWVLPNHSSSTEAATTSLWIASPMPSPSPTIGHHSFIPNGEELMREMWFTSQDNVNLLLEVCRQGFHGLPTTPKMKALIDLYLTWVQSPEKPIFMHPPAVRTSGETTAQGTNIQQEKTPMDQLTLPQYIIPGGLPPSGFVQPWEVLISYEGYNSADVRAGLQASLRMCIAHTSQIFLVKLDSNDALGSQVEICRKVIRLYQDIASAWILDQSSWEYLLAVLLHLTLELLQGDPPENRDTTLGGNLASTLLKTLFVCFLRASMVMKVPSDQWDSLLAVLSSLTQWKEVIIQWKSTMETMTQVLAQTVYGLDLHDLPLNKLERDDHRNRYRPRTRTITPASNTDRIIGRMSFSKIDTPPLTSKRTADEKVIRGKLRKADTEVKDDSPPYTPRAWSRHVSCTPALPFTEVRNERSCSNVVPPRKEELAVAEAPGRSSSAGAALPEISEGVEPSPTYSLPPVGSGIDVITIVGPSPTASLPPDVPRDKYRESTASLPPDVPRDKYRESTGSDDVIWNPHVATPSPEPEEVDPGKLKGMQELDNREVERKQTERKVSPLRTKRQPALDNLVLKNREYRSPEPEGLTGGRSLSFQSPLVTADVSLVLENENSRDSVISELELDSNKPESQDSPIPSYPRKFSLLRKSSSDSNLSRQTTKPSDSPRSKTAEDTAKIQRFHRVNSSVDTKVDMPSTRENFSLCDLFSSSIIPISHTGMISSPVRVSPQPLLPSPSKGATVPSPEHLLSPTGEPTDLSGRLSPRHLAGRLSPRHLAGQMSPCRLSIEMEYSSPPSSSPPPLVGLWNPVIAAIVWQRMLRILGNINDIRRPAIHAEAMVCLQSIWKSLTEIEANSGISLDNQSTPTLPEFMPPLLLIAPWILKACSMPPNYSRGRLVAYQMLCDMTIKHSHTPLPFKPLTHFYQLMHEGLQPSSNVLAVAVKSGYRLFSYGLVGSSVLLSDCIIACASILSLKTSEAPHLETLYLLGSMLYLLELYYNMWLPQLGGEKVLGIQLKEKLVDALFMAAKKEPQRTSRCLSLYQIGMLAFSELRTCRPSQRLLEGIDILLTSLQFADRSVSMAAVDMLSLLVEVAPQIRELYPSMPVRVIEAICYAIAIFMTEEGEQQASWVDKVIVTQILCLRDWLMALPIQEMIREGSLPDAVFKNVFEVLQAAASSPKQVVAKRHAIAQLASIRNPTTTILDPLEGGRKSPTRGSMSHLSISFRRSGDDFRRHSSDVLKAHLGPEANDRVQVAARSVLTHLLNLLGHFPFGCGAAQMASVVREYHDCPSLEHLDDLSADIFDSPRIQFFSFNDSAVITFVEIPSKLEGVPGSVMTASYQTRLIVRDVTGKYTWDSAVLYGSQQASPDNAPLCGVSPPTAGMRQQLDQVPSLTKAESFDSLETLGVTVEPPAIPDYVPPSRDPLQPPTWRTHINTDRDILEDLLNHLETTSPECLLYPGQVGLSEPAPPSSEGVECLERVVVGVVDQQHNYEQQYTREAFILPSMCAERTAAPRHFPSSFAFHHCRVLLSHLGMFGWSKRNHLDLLEKNNHLILELKHLDSIQVQSRQTYKVAVLYVAPGQEDKQSILSNSRGSKEFEEFVAGLGWEVNMETHAGYMGGLKREFCANCTLPYYATSSEEVLFHVSTRMPRGRDVEQKVVEQKVRHLGNDEVHIVWSEHWRDYRRTIFKTQFADVLIVIYPLPNKLFRVQINKKQNIPQFGPLFDGALVDRGSLSSLVRATSVNALRAQRTPLVSYRGRYEERMRYIHNIVEKKLKSSFEDFTQNVMHPLESTAAASTTVLRHSPQKPLTTSSIPVFSVPPTNAQSVSSPDPKWSLSPKPGVASILKRSREHMERGVTGSLPSRRPRASTNDDRMLSQSLSGSSLTRNRSVPENLSELGKSGSPKKGLSPAGSKSSLSAKLLHRTSPILLPKTNKNKVPHSLADSQ